MSGCAGAWGRWAVNGSPRRGRKPMRPGCRAFAPTWRSRSWPCAGNIRRSGTAPGLGPRPGLVPRPRTRTDFRAPYAGSGREVLAGLHEVDLRPALLDQAEVDARRSQVYQLARMID